MALVIPAGSRSRIFRQFRNTGWYSQITTTELKCASHQTLNAQPLCLSLNNIRWFCLTKRTCQEAKPKNERTEKALAELHESPYRHLTLGGKVKQATKDASYLGIIIAGVSVTALMFYAIFRELFSKQSPNGVYTQALKECKNNSKVIDAIGEPIKGYGETTSRGRRRHVSHLEYVQDDVNHMRMKFYIEGSRRKGTVHLDVQENSKGRYEYRYLFVELDGFSGNTIVLHDNRYREIE